MDSQTFFGAVCVVGGFAGTGLYLWDVLKNGIKPHLLSWIVWGLLAAIAAAVAFVGGAMVSACVIGAGALMNFSVAGLAVKYGEKSITRSDWVSFLSALAIIPLWVATKEPLLAAILVIVIDLFAAYPTVRKAWGQPHHENLRVFVIFVVISLCGVLAVDPYTLVTGLCPTETVLINLALATIIFIRRRRLPRAAIV